MNKDFNIQNQFLNKIRKARVQVVVQIKGDRTFQGIITAFDNYSILLKERENTPPILIFKHSIGYIFPLKRNDEINNLGEEF